METSIRAICLHQVMVNKDGELSYRREHLPEAPPQLQYQDKNTKNTHIHLDHCI
jgi:hypothetical protein